MRSKHLSNAEKSAWHRADVYGVLWSALLLQLSLVLTITRQTRDPTVKMRQSLSPRGGNRPLGFAQCGHWVLESPGEGPDPDLVGSEKALGGRDTPVET